MRHLELVSTCLIDTVIVIFDVLIVTRHGLVTLIDQENRPNLVVICCRFSHLDRDRDQLRYHDVKVPNHDHGGFKTVFNN